MRKTLRVRITRGGKKHIRTTHTDHQCRHKILLCIHQTRCTGGSLQRGTPANPCDTNHQQCRNMYTSPQCVDKYLLTIRRVRINNTNDQHCANQFQVCADDLPCTNHSAEMFTNNPSRGDQC